MASLYLLSFDRQSPPLPYTTHTHTHTDHCLTPLLPSQQALWWVSDPPQGPAGGRALLGLQREGHNPRVSRSQTTTLEVFMQKQRHDITKETHMLKDVQR